MTSIHRQKPSDSAATVLERLRHALSSDGDFPVRAKIITELRALVDNPHTTLEKISECILREPSLGTRVLDYVNSGFYGNQSEIVTVSQAVVRLGTRAIADLCSGLVLLQRFVSSAKRGGVFAENVSRCILISLSSTALAHCVDNKEEGLKEKGYLAGVFYSIGTLLLAYYFPHVIDQADKRSKMKAQSLRKSLHEMLGLYPVDLSLGVVESLSIPDLYKKTLVDARALLDVTADRWPEPLTISHSIVTADLLTEIAMESTSVQEIESRLAALATLSGFALSDLTSIARGLPEAFEAHCKMIEMGFLTLPPAIEQFKKASEGGHSTVSPQKPEKSGEQFSQHLEEIRESVQNGDTLSSVITSVMELLVYYLHFERALLLMTDPNNTQLEGKLSLGAPLPIEPNSRCILLDGTEPKEAPDVKCLKSRQVETYGDPLFDDGWPFAAIPIGRSESPVGVIYADRRDENGNAEPLDLSVQYALNVVCELLNDAAKAND